MFKKPFFVRNRWKKTFAHFRKCKTISAFSEERKEKEK